MKKEKESAIKRVSIISMISNLVLLVMKMIFGVISKSQSLIADAVNSAGDIFASLVSFIGVKVAAKPQDEDHPYGHGKAEYIFAALIGISMIIASLVMIKNAIFSIIEGATVEVSIPVIIVCFITIIVKCILMFYAKYENKKNSSILIKSNFEDHRNDIFVTSGVLIGIIFSAFGYYFIDGIIGILISIWIIIVAIKIIYPAYLVLMDTQGEFISDAKSELEKFDKIISIDRFYANPVGDKYIAIVEISMDSETKLGDIHEYIEEIEKHLKNKFDYLIDVVIHVNPIEIK